MPNFFMTFPLKRRDETPTYSAGASMAEYPNTASGKMYRP